MEIKQLLQSQIEEAGYQLEKVLEGADESTLDLKVTAEAMSPREMVEHLCECYTATLKTAAGEAHEWGTYSAPDMTTGPLMEEFKSLRASAAAAVLALDDDKAAELGSAFVVGHDFYHVGQLVLARLKADANWNSYSIYRM